MSDFHSVQNFLDRCHKRRYVPFAMNTVRDLVYRQDKKLLNMTNKALEQPPLNESSARGVLSVVYRGYTRFFLIRCQ